MLRTSRKKVTFADQLASTREINTSSKMGHRKVLQSYLPVILKWLSGFPLSYRILKKNGVLTTEQIGEIELEDTSEHKVVKLLEIIQNAEPQVFDSFCHSLGEMGFLYLAQTLQSAVKEKGLPSSPGKYTELKNTVKNVVPLCPYDTAVKEETRMINQKIQYINKEYNKRLKDLEEELILVEEERDEMLREMHKRKQQNEELRGLNLELRTLVHSLQRSILDHITIKNVGYGIKIMPRS
ncbi:uncharacterized protein LOC120532143 isoform X1 [Polypterus senegalus]|uniref:uncharacterized protein LOC120532143 isoform X1 n=2 Tax=Polypterus senegalus TaxID=55291 RepID=UPI0019638171|nr:uncharacterized protein LOC120532143 isoform X1 [Polypterus senegalus]